MAQVVLKHLEKKYPNGFHAVRDVNLEIADGEFMVLVGPSGCGKSTTLRMVAGLEEVSGGEIWIGDRLVNDVAPGDRDIAMVFQNYALYPHMSVYQNMAFGLKMRRTPKAEIDRRVREAAAILSIEALLDRRPARAFRRAAATCGARPRDRARAKSLSVRRAAIESRCETARANARRDRAAASAFEDDDHLRDARPGGGDDARRSHRADGPRRDPAGRFADGDLSTAREPVRRVVRRQPGDEFHSWANCRGRL